MSDSKKLLLLKILVAVLGLIFVAGLVFTLTYQPVSDATIDETTSAAKEAN